MEHMGPPIKTTERGIMKNADGTCCFMDSLLVALLFPSYRGFFDNNLLDPDLSTAPTVCDLALRQRVQNALRHVAHHLRGWAPASESTYRNLRSDIAACSSSLCKTQDFTRSEGDATELFVYLMEVCGVGALFQTKLHIEKVYATRVETESRVENQMFETLYQFLLKSTIQIGGAPPHQQQDGTHTTHLPTPTSLPTPRLDQYFPQVEVDHVPENEYGLKEKRSLLQFHKGRILCFTRERQPAQRLALHYGDVEEGTRAYLLRIVTDTGTPVVFRLCSVVCWAGMQSATTSTGHYVAYVYDSGSACWYFYNDSDTHPSIQGCSRLHAVPLEHDIETWPCAPAGFSFLRGTRRLATSNDPVPVFVVRNNLTGEVKEVASEAEWETAKLVGDKNGRSMWRPSTQGTMFFYERL